MNELDFIDALSNPCKEKTAGAMDFLKRTAPQIGAGLAGAALMGGATYLRSRQVGGRPSADQRLTQVVLTSSEAIKDQAERDNRPLTFREDLTDAMAPGSKRLADVLARHPVKGALMVAPIGAYAGLRILKALK